MRKLVMFFIMVFPSALLAQKNEEITNSTLIINALSEYSIRYEVRRNELLEINLMIRSAHIKKEWPGAIALAGIPLLNQNQPSGVDKQPMTKRMPALNFGILSSLSTLKIFKDRSTSVFVEIKYYSAEGKLLGTKRRSGSGKTLKYKMTKPMDKDGYLIISFRNLEKKTLAINSAITNTGPHPPKGGIPGEGGETPQEPGTESDAPIAWENYIDGVTIVGTGTFANNNFMANYEASLGPSATWIAVGAGTGGGDGGSGGDGGYEPPSAEAKAIARE